MFRRRTSGAAVPEPGFDIVDHHLLEVGGHCSAAQRRHLFAIDEYWRSRLLASARERNADIGVLAFAGSIDDAAHHGDVEPLHTGIAPLPLGHGCVDEALIVAGEFLKVRRGRPSASRTGGDEGHKNPKATGLY